MSAYKPVISEMTLACGVPVNILFANTREVEGKAVGQMVIELPEERSEADKITDYLTENTITFEEVQ